MEPNQPFLWPFLRNQSEIRLEAKTCNQYHRTDVQPTLFHRAWKLCQHGNGRSHKAIPIPNSRWPSRSRAWQVDARQLCDTCASNRKDKSGQEKKTSNSTVMTYLGRFLLDWGNHTRHPISSPWAPKHSHRGNEQQQKTSTKVIIC